METPRPPAYAWDWFARQRLLWREARRRLDRASSPVAIRYHQAADKGDVLALLREDYGRDAVVRDVVHGVIGDLTFLGRTGVPFETLGARNAPRGMRWWWTQLTGEEIAPRRPAPARVPDRQLSLDDVLEGYGD